MSSETQTQVVRLGSECLYSEKYSSGPYLYFKMFYNCVLQHWCIQIFIFYFLLLLCTIFAFFVSLFFLLFRRQDMYYYVAQASTDLSMKVRLALNFYYLAIS